MKQLFIIILFIISSFNNTKKEKNTSITLSENYKVKSTFSGDTANKESFHIIIAKNTDTKGYDLIPIRNTDGDLKKMKAISFKKQPSVLSYHNNNNEVTLITLNKGKKKDEFSIIDINIKTGETSKSQISYTGMGTYRTVLRQKNESLLLFSNKEAIEVVKAVNTKDTKTITAQATKKNKGLLKVLYEGAIIDAINTNEFVANGSLKKIKAFAENNTIYILNEHDREGVTYISRVDLNKGKEVTLEANTYGKEQGIRVKKQTSFIYEGKLYQLIVDKKKANLSISNLNSEDKKVIDLKTVKINKKTKGFKTLESFFKKASRLMYEPTLTVNKTKSGNVALRFDYVNKNEYSYHYDWWWHHFMWQEQQNMMHQSIRNNAPKFGPSPIEDEVYYVGKKHYFEIVLNEEGEIINNVDTYETVHKEIDKKEHIDILEDDLNVKYASSVFIDNKLRYFGFDRQSKKFRVIYKILND